MRRLHALAVAAALVGPTVASAAEIKMPEVYGRLHVSANHMDNGPDSVLNLSDNSSRLGFRGDMELAPGLKAIYQIEAGLSADEGGGELASRNTFLGVSGAFGTLQAGQFDTPVKTIGSKVDLFGDQVGDNGNIIRGVAPHFDQREDNMIQYTSPSLSGFQVALAYSTNVDTGSAQDGLDEETYVAALNYTAAKNFYLGLGYQIYGEDASAVTGEESSIIRLGATYQLGDLKLAGLVQQATDVNAGATPALNDDVLAYGLGAAYALGKVVLKTQYYALDTDEDEGGADMISVGVDYKLTKQFTTYAVYSRISNEDNQNLRPFVDGINDPLDAGAAGETTQGFGVGAIYNF